MIKEIFSLFAQTVDNGKATDREQNMFTRIARSELPDLAFMSLSNVKALNE